MSLWQWRCLISKSLNGISWLYFKLFYLASVYMRSSPHFLYRYLCIWGMIHYPSCVLFLVVNRWFAWYGSDTYVSILYLCYILALPCLWCEKQVFIVFLHFVAEIVSLGDFGDLSSSTKTIIAVPTAEDIQNGCSQGARWRGTEKHYRETGAVCGAEWRQLRGHDEN